MTVDGPDVLTVLVVNAEGIEVVETRAEVEVEGLKAGGVEEAAVEVGGIEVVKIRAEVEVDGIEIVEAETKLELSVLAAMVIALALVVLLVEHGVVYALGMLETELVSGEYEMVSAAAVEEEVADAGELGMMVEVKRMTVVAVMDLLSLDEDEASLELELEATDMLDDDGISGVVDVGEVALVEAADGVTVSMTVVGATELAGAVTVAYTVSAAAVADVSELPSTSTIE